MAAKRLVVGQQGREARTNRRIYSQGLIAQLAEPAQFEQTDALPRQPQPFFAGVDSAVGTVGQLGQDVVSRQAPASRPSQELRPLLPRRRPREPVEEAPVKGNEAAHSPLAGQNGIVRVEPDGAAARAHEPVGPPLGIDRPRADSGDHKAAAADVQELAGAKALSGPVLYDLACVFSLCSAAARQDTGLPEGDREKASEAYAIRAIALLQRAEVARFFNDSANVTHAHDDPDLDALRKRPDFMKLLASLGTKDKPSKN